MVSSMFHAGHHRHASFPDYWAPWQVRSIVFATGVTTDLQYWDTHQRLQLLQTTGPGGSLQNLSYDVYDLAGNISSIQDNNSPVRDQAFTYEPKPTNRLETAQTGAYGNLFMGYDTTDNFTSYTPVGPFTPAPGYSGRLLSAGPYPSGISHAFAYDDNGNMTGIAKTDSQGQTILQRTIAYDVENRPSAVDVNGVVTSFQYDFTGMRVKKTTGQSSTLYFGNLYECTDGACAKHIFAGDRRIATKMSATEIYFYHPDHLGSTQVVTNASGAAVHTLFYEPYGDVCTDCETGSSPIRHKYTGQEEDSETGFYYYKSRYYDPVIGRFLSADPLFLAAFDPSTYPRLHGFNYSWMDAPISSLNTQTASVSRLSAMSSLKPISKSGSKPNRDKSALYDASFNSVFISQLNNIYASSLYKYAENNPMNRIDPFGTRDFFIYWEGDLVGIAGLEGSLGIVIDFEDLKASGLFRTIGVAVGANVGWAVGVGYVARDIEGWSYNLDANIGAVSPTVIADDVGLSGFAIGVGPGAGLSLSATYTWTYSIEDLLQDISSLITYIPDSSIDTSDVFWE